MITLQRFYRNMNKMWFRVLLCWQRFQEERIPILDREEDERQLRHSSSSTNLKNTGVYLPEEMWIYIFELSNFDASIPKTCKKWHRIYWQTFQFAPGELRWRRSLLEIEKENFDLSYHGKSIYGDDEDDARRHEDDDEEEEQSISKIEEQRLRRLARAIHIFLFIYGRSCRSLFADSLTAAKGFLLAVRGGDVAVTLKMWKEEKRLTKEDYQLAAWVARHTSCKPMEMLFDLKVQGLELPVDLGINADVITSVLFSGQSEWWRLTKADLANPLRITENDDAESPRMWSRGDTAMITLSVVHRILEGLGFIVFIFWNIMLSCFDVCDIFTIAFGLTLLFVAVELAKGDVDQLYTFGSSI
eukprot:TRINITY_DN5825_c0_g1_i1.p1 TRINITY_DN5825_c0_g1~~TRINITY_DN5825_c0_g1_i1.p1  ORF type:complete len:375 (+),score=83.38 TRINITY_DN5825_c0_g1_i1:54-1127(+)